MTSFGNLQSLKHTLTQQKVYSSKAGWWANLPSNLDTSFLNSMIDRFCQRM